MGRPRSVGREGESCSDERTPGTAGAARRPAAGALSPYGSFPSGLRNGVRSAHRQVWSYAQARCAAFGFVSAGALHPWAVSTDRYADCWGIDGAGELGTGSFHGPGDLFVPEVPCSTRPVRVVGERLYREVSAGNGPHSFGVTLPGRVLCWGDHSSGQLRDGTTTSRPRPRLVEGSAGPPGRLDSPS